MASINEPTEATKLEGEAAGHNNKYTKPSRPPPTGRGRSVPHVLVACRNCKLVKIKCSGGERCVRCTQRKMECIYDRSTRFKNKGSNCIPESWMLESRRREMETSSSSSSSSQHKDEDDDNDSSNVDKDYNAGDDDDNDNNKKQSVQHKKSRKRRQRQEEKEEYDLKDSSSGSSSISTEIISSATASAMGAERILADKSTATYLMDLFGARILPHFIASHSLPPTFFFEAALLNPTTSSDEMQRDGALALACRACGHEVLATLLIKRMEILIERVREEKVSVKSYTAFSILTSLIINQNIQKGIEAAGLSSRMYRALATVTDPMASTCEVLDVVSQRALLNFDSYGGIYDQNGIYGLRQSVARWQRMLSAAEISAHVQMAISQLISWSRTLLDVRLRRIVCMSLEWKGVVPMASFRPALVMHVALLIDLHLLGCLIPPYIMEIMHRHDPENKCGLSEFFIPCESADSIPEPIVLNEEFAEPLLRRIIITRLLFFASGAPIESLSPYVVAISFLECVLLWRTSPKQKYEAEALNAAYFILHVLESADLNFWPATVSQNLIVLGCIFFEMGDMLRLINIISILERIKRSQPGIIHGISALRELQAAMIINSQQQQQEDQQ